MRNWRQLLQMIFLKFWCEGQLRHGVVVTRGEGRVNFYFYSYFFQRWMFVANGNDLVEKEI